VVSSTEGSAPVIRQSSACATSALAYLSPISIGCWSYSCASETPRSRNHGATGLDLTIVRNLMHQQHGDVVLANVKDERGTGLEARLIIPLAR
jgi:hypothetical protein